MTHSPMSQNRVRDALKKAERALKPFAGRVYNDNGDVTVSDTYLCGLDEFTAAYFAHHSILAALTAPPASDAAGAEGLVKAGVEAAIAAAIRGVNATALNLGGDCDRRGSMDMEAGEVPCDREDEEGCACSQALDFAGLAIKNLRSMYVDKVVADVLAVAPTAPAQAPQNERVRHVKRGTEYEVLGEAEAQVSTGFNGRRFLEDGKQLMVYRAPQSGKLWCRFTDEFRDGRFVTTAPAQAPSRPVDAGGVEAEHLVAKLRAEAEAMHAAVHGECLHDTLHLMNWNDKPHRVVFDAARLLREAAAMIAALATQPTGTEASRPVGNPDAAKWAETLRNSIRASGKKGWSQFHDTELGELIKVLDLAASLTPSQADSTQVRGQVIRAWYNPGQHAGNQGDRSRDEWCADAVIASLTPSQADSTGAKIVRSMEQAVAHAAGDNTALEALWDAIHEAMICAWNLLDGTEDDASGVDQADWDALSAAMEAMGALIPETEQPFSPSYAVPYLRAALNPPASIAAPVRDGGAREVLKAKAAQFRAEAVEYDEVGSYTSADQARAVAAAYDDALASLPAPATPSQADAQTQEGGR